MVRKNYCERCHSRRKLRLETDVDGRLKTLCWTCRKLIKQALHQVSRAA